MSSERDIEKLLRQAAEKRRAEAGAPFELHPADRRLLQGKVRQRWPGRAAAASGAAPDRLFPRLAWSFGLLAVIFLGAFLVLPVMNKAKSKGPMAMATPPQDQDLAKDRAAGATSTLARREPVAAPEADYLAAGRDASGVGRNLQMSADAPLRVQEPMVANSGYVAAESSRRVESGSPPAPAGSAEMAIAPSSASVLARAEEAKSDRLREIATDEKATLNRSFALSGAAAGSTMTGDTLNYQAKLKAAALVQNYSRAMPAAKPANSKGTVALVASDIVLNRFQFANEADLVSVVDADGSVYKGAFQARPAGNSIPAKSQSSADKNETLADSAQRQDAAGAAWNQAAPTELYFEVIGTNVSLKQKVVFTGTVTPLPSNTLQVRTDLQNNASNQIQTEARNQILLQNGQIRGRVHLPEGQVFDLEAVPSP
jgi:hypothetical protein